MTIDIGNQKIVNVTDPTNPQDAATKAYVDASGGGLTNVISTNTTITFGSTGTYSSCKLAKDYLADKFILPGVVVTLQPSGTLTELPFTTDHPQEGQIQYIGTTDALSFSSSVSLTSNGASDHDWIIQLSSVGTCAVGQYVLIRAITGTGEIGSLSGCHKITNVNSGANRITLKLRDKSASIGSFTVSAMTIRKHNAIMDFSASLTSGVACITIKNQPLLIDGMVLVGNPSTASTDGVQLTWGVRGDCIGQNFSIADQGRHGFYAFEGSSSEIVDVCISNCQSSGLKIESYASFAATRVCISGCLNGATVNGGYILMNSSRIGGCSKGIYSNDYGIIITSGYVTGCTTGMEVTTGGKITDLGTTFSGNTANYSRTINTIDGYAGGIFDTTGGAAVTTIDCWGVSLSDVSTPLTVGTLKESFRVPFNATITGVKASVITAPTGSTVIVDINKNGSSILSTKMSIDASERTSATAATPAVISDTTLIADDELTFDIDQVGSTIKGAGLKVYIFWRR